MAAKGDRHMACVMWLTDRLVLAANRRYLARVQDTVRLPPRSVPEPDLALLRFREYYYRTGGPTPEDILLVIEVADSTVSYDRNRKAPIYARAGIQEMWLVNLRRGVVEVFRNPTEDGYTSTTIARRGDSVTPLALPDVALSITEMLG